MCCSDPRLTTRLRRQKSYVLARATKVMSMNELDALRSDERTRAIARLRLTGLLDESTRFRDIRTAIEYLAAALSTCLSDIERVALCQLLAGLHEEACDEANETESAWDDETTDSRSPEDLVHALAFRTWLRSRRDLEKSQRVANEILLARLLKRVEVRRGELAVQVKSYREMATGPDGRFNIARGLAARLNAESLRGIAARGVRLGPTASPEGLPTEIRALLSSGGPDALRDATERLRAALAMFPHDSELLHLYAIACEKTAVAVQPRVVDLDRVALDATLVVQGRKDLDIDSQGEVAASIIRIGIRLFELDYVVDAAIFLQNWCYSHVLAHNSRSIVETRLGNIQGLVADGAFAAAHLERPEVAIELLENASGILLAAREDASEPRHAHEAHSPARGDASADSAAVVPTRSAAIQANAARSAVPIVYLAISQMGAVAAVIWPGEPPDAFVSPHVRRADTKILVEQYWGRYGRLSELLSERADARSVASAVKEWSAASDVLHAYIGPTFLESVLERLVNRNATRVQIVRSRHARRFTYSHRTNRRSGLQPQ